MKRHQLHAMVQTAGETASVFIQRLKYQANKCDFGNLKNDLVLMQFIFGIF